MKKNTNKSLIIECANVAEMHELANYSNNRVSIGLHGEVEICISGVMHYFVVKDEKYRKTAMRWLKQHASSVAADLLSECMEDELCYKPRFHHYMQKVMQDVVSSGTIYPELPPTPPSAPMALVA
jgi:hypothetical protein